MIIRKIIVAIAATCYVNVYAQTNYEKLEIGSIVQNSIGIGTFVKPIAIPSGEWILVSKSMEEKNLTTRGGDSRNLTYVSMTLKSKKMDLGPVAAIVVIFTPDSSNIDYINNKCESKNPNIIADDFGTNPGSTLYLCGITFAWSSFRKALSSASQSTNQWIKNNFTALSAFVDEMPDDVLVRTIEGNKFRGRHVSYTFVAKRSGDFPKDPAYAKYATDWTHADGPTLENVLNNREAIFTIPVPFVTQK